LAEAFGTVPEVAPAIPLHPSPPVNELLAA
jgi:hypothetical protein